MCGIIGQIFFGSNERADCSPAINLLRHRGPDSSGVKHFLAGDCSISLGHTRLSIIDLSDAASQPMLSFHDDFCIVFNGEIYNFDELRASLIAAGYRFRTTSDTEVLLIGYQHYGSEICSKLNGMFAFAILDLISKSLFIGRDPFGKKPLYLYQDEKQFSFSSELIALAQLPGIGTRLTIDKLSIVKFYSFGFIPHPHSIYTQIEKFPPGHYLTFSLETKRIVNKTCFWNLHQYANEDIGRMNEYDLILKIDELIENGVARRLKADVPVCAFLSGGVDSSLVLAKAAKINPNIKSFSVSFDGYSANELPYAIKVAQHLGLKNEAVEMGVDEMTIAAELFLNNVDEPIGDAAVLPLFYLSKYVSSSYKVAIGGDGGDELFGGYSKYKFQKYLQMFSVLAPTISWMKNIKCLPDGLRRIAEGSSLNFYERQFIFGSGGFLPTELKHLIRYEQLDTSTIFEDFKVAAEELVSIDVVNRSMAMDCKFQLPDWYLTKADRATMAASVELRSPLLDKELAEFIFGISGSLKIKGGESKYLLKKLTSKFIPSELIYRKKLGFSVDFNSWTKTNYFKEMLFNINENSMIDIDWFSGNESGLSPLRKMRIAFMNHYLNKIEAHRISSMQVISSSNP